MSTQRLAKLIASRGLASRREAESWIREGRVTIDGEVATSPALTIDPSEVEIRVDGRVLPVEPHKVYYVLYKPKGFITGREDPEGRRSVLELVEDIGLRVEPVGRLDFDTEGVLLLTNDGDLANALTHPSNNVPKRYRAKVYRTPDARDIEAIQDGIFLDDGRTKPAKARIVDTTDTENAWIEITVTEGRNRLIRRMMAQLGHPVSKLRRESFATIALGALERGQYRSLTAEELRRVKAIAEGERPEKSGRLHRKEGYAKPKPKPKRILGRKKRHLAKLNKKSR